MRARRGLLLHRPIPPRIEVDHRIRAGQVESRAARFQADEKKWNTRVILEAVHFGLTFHGLSVEITETQFSPPGLVAEEMQHAHELAEEEHAMPAVDGLVDQLERPVPSPTAPSISLPP